MVTVVHGPDTEQADLTGRSVQEAREAYRHVFSIPDDAIAKVNFPTGALFRVRSSIGRAACS